MQRWKAQSERRGLDILRRDLIAPRGVGQTQSLVAHRIDQARRTARITDHCGKTFRLENLAAMRAGDGEPVDDVAVGLLRAQRLEVKSQARTLRESLKLRRLE